MVAVTGGCERDGGLGSGEGSLGYVGGQRSGRSVNHGERRDGGMARSWGEGRVRFRRVEFGGVG